MIEGDLLFFLYIDERFRQAQHFLGYILSTKLSFCILFLFSNMCTFLHRRDYAEQKAVLVV